ncbi:non-ribosomal peptide synthetase, partial [Paenibacillus sp. NAIST15-1]|uniref:non-ribosomal peptide synthetase n=1 Tax=Paenibacillus sp. NAIST15-1 TaxID=1605994 RepID=UPI0009335C29
CAYYVADGDLEAGEVRTYLAERLPSYMVPAYLVALEAMPLTPNGKLNRKALPAPEENVEREAYVAPRNELERQLAAVWQEVLGLERIGIDERYQDIGGDSIKSIRILSTIRKICQTNLQLLEFYQHSTIRELAGFLDRRKYEQENGRIVAAKVKLENWQLGLLSSAAGTSLHNEEIEDFFPLSDIQQGMIYHSVSQPHDQLYHEQFVYEFQDTAFSERIFEQAMEHMIRKHAILRTTFNLNDFPAPVQLVHRSVPMNLEVIALDHLTREEQTAYLKAFLEQDRQKPFFRGTQSSNPMWRLRIFRLDERNFCLAWLYHHAIMDGWSNASFITELTRVYFGLKRGITALEPLRHSYKDLLIEQWSIQDDPGVNAYWQEELKDYRRFEPMFAPEENQPEPFIRKEFVLDGELEKSLLVHSAKLNRVSVKTMLFTAYVCMMNTYDAENDFVVGLVENNRPLVEDGEKILGCFLNSIPVRIRMNELINWRDLLLAMDKKLAKVQQFGRLSLARIQQAVGESAVYGNKLFDNIFNYVDLHVYEGVSREQRSHRSLGDIGNYERTNALFQFDCFMEDERLHIVVAHVTGVYPKADVARMISIYERILKQMLHRPEAIVSKTSLLDPEQLRLLQERAKEGALLLPEEKTIGGLVEEQAKRTPQRTALIGRSGRLTYAELNRRADRLARQLADRGVRAGHIVGLMAERSPGMIVGLLAILKAGAAYLPIDPDYPDERILHMLADSGTSLLLTQKQYSGRTTFSGEMINLADEELYREKAEGDSARPPVRMDDLAYCIYTSGSTGLPKGVLIEHRAVVNLLAGITELIDFQADKTILSVTTISFDIFVLETLVPLMKGMCVVLADAEEQLDPAALGRLMLHHGVHMLQTTPSRLRLLLDDDTAVEGLAKLTDVMIGGEAFGMDLVQKLRECSHTRIYNMYGPTETTVWSMVADLTETKDVTLGQPIANTEILLLDQNDQLQPFGTAGELCIAGTGLARGYHNRTDLTQAKFVTHPLDPGQRIYKTGDLARWQADGRMTYIGRRDHQVKIRGYRVEISEIEQALAGYHGIATPLVAARERDDGEVYLVGYYLADNELPIASLREHLADRLPPYMIPGAFVRLGRYPLLPNGKINHAALPEPTLTRKALVAEFRKASNDTEQRLADLWQEIVGLETIGMDDNFFEVGGSSISLVQFHSKLEKIYPNRIGVTELFSYPTLGKLAARVERTAQKRQIAVDTLKLPGSFLNRSGGENGDSLRFHLSSLYQLHGLARQYGVEPDDILLTAGLYLFSEITELSAITVQAMARKENELIPLTLDMREISDFPQLFQRVNRMRTEAADAYGLEDIRPLAIRGAVGEIAPLFYKHELDTSRERLSDLFGFTLGYSVEADKIVFTCDYDSGAIRQKSMEEWAAGYARLLRVLTDQFLKEATQQ